MTSPLRRTEATLADVPRPLRPFVWGVAALITPFWLLADLVRRTAGPLWRALRTAAQALAAVWRALTAPFRLLVRGLVAAFDALGRLLRCDPARGDVCGMDHVVVTSP